MISTSDFRKGSTKILFNNEPWLILDYHSVKPGKGGTYLKTKMKNLLTGRVLEETFRSAEKFPEPDLEQKQMQYLYKDEQEMYRRIYYECVDIMLSSLSNRFNSEALNLLSDIEQIIISACRDYLFKIYGKRKCNA